MGIEGIENLKEEGATQDTSAAPPVDITPAQPTTSPDVKIIEDPGPAPEGDAPVDDGSVDPLAEEDPNVVPIATEENPSA